MPKPKANGRTADGLLEPSRTRLEEVVHPRDDARHAGYGLPDH